MVHFRGPEACPISARFCRSTFIRECFLAQIALKRKSPFAGWGGGMHASQSPDLAAPRGLDSSRVPSRYGSLAGGRPKSIYCGRGWGYLGEPRAGVGAG